MSHSDPHHVVLLALDSFDADSAASLSHLSGWHVSTVARDADLVEALRDIEAHAAVIDAAKFEALGERLLAIRRTPIVCAGADDVAAARAALDAGAAGWVIAPTSVAAVASAVEVAVRWFGQVATLLAEKQLLSQTLETRKLVERAKAIFMNRLKIDEATAHKRLQQESQNRRIGLAELARRLIESEEMMTTPEGTAAQKSG